MTETYNPQRHTMFRVRGVRTESPLLPIIHSSGRGDAVRIWTQLGYSDTMPEGWHVVRDENGNAEDEMGSFIVSLPLSAVTAFYDDEEADEIDAMQAIDERLLRYAIG